MRPTIFKKFSMILHTLQCVFFMSCAGPTTPFGPTSMNDHSKIHRIGNLKTLPIEESKSLRKREATPSSSISFSPSRQMLHKKFNLLVSVHSEIPITNDAQFMFFYDNKDITDTFMKSSTKSISRDRKTLYLRVPNLYLPSRLNNNIQFYFLPNSLAKSIQTTYKTPECDLVDSLSISNTVPFFPNPTILSWIETYSKIKGVNPSLIAGLIAQESSFNSQAVSWAKAIGLTQITNLAVPAVQKQYPKWNTYPHTKSLPFPLVKTYIQAGKINQKNDWRLHPEKSIQGGITYLKSLENYWNRAAAAPKIATIVGRNPVEKTKVLLASYNSGAARVKYEMNKHGKDWLRSDNLKEARTYVRKIFSYCHHFGQKELPL